MFVSGSDPAISMANASLFVNHLMERTTSGMRFTRYLLETRQRPDRSSIEIEWIERTVACPEQRLVQEDGRIRVWSQSSRG